MKTHRRKRITPATWLLATAIALTASPSGAAGQKPNKDQANADKAHKTSATEAHDTTKIKIAPDDVDHRTAENFTGKDVRGSRGNHIGNLADVIVDRQTGKIVFYAVSSGGVAGIGDTVRLVPFQAMARATNDDGFTASVSEAQWEKMPVIDEQDFEAGRINITADQQRQFAAVHGNDGAVSNHEAGNPGDFGGRLARAAKLRGKDVHADHREVGEIEAVVLDLDEGTATALMDADDNFARTDRNYLVPLRHFQLTADRDGLTTTLAATDFPHTAATIDREAVTGTATATDANRVAAEERPASDASNQDTAAARQPTNSGDEQLTPTGRDDKAAANRNVDPAVQSAARSVRQIWDASPDLAKLDLRVTPENGKLIFRGSVPNVDLWERAKDTAEGVVRGIQIENQITIANRER